MYTENTQKGKTPKSVMYNHGDATPQLQLICSFGKIFREQIYCRRYAPGSKATLRVTSPGLRPCECSYAEKFGKKMTRASVRKTLAKWGRAENRALLIGTDAVCMPNVCLN